MSKPPEFRRLVVEDFIDQSPWIDRLFAPLNLFNEQVAQMFNKQLEIGTNVVGKQYSVSFTTSATYTASKTFVPIKLVWDQPAVPGIMLVGYAKNKASNSGPMTNAVTCAWSYPTVGTLQVDYIAGLADSTTYVVNLVAF